MREDGPLKRNLEQIKAKASPVSVAFYDSLAQKLAASGLLAQSLRPGDTIPDFALPDSEGRIISSASLLERGPLVLSFYRGEWCPYCRAELDALQEALPAIREAGATLVCVTPESGGLAAATRAARSLDFEILVDMDHGLALAFGLVYRLSPEQQAHYLRHGVDMPLINGSDGWLLPVPATYVVRPDGVVASAFIEPDPRERMEPESIVATVRAITLIDVR